MPAPSAARPPRARLTVRRPARWSPAYLGTQASSVRRATPLGPYDANAPSSRTARLRALTNPTTCPSGYCYWPPNFIGPTRGLPELTRISMSPQPTVVPYLQLCRRLRSEPCALWRRSTDGVTITSSGSSPRALADDSPGQQL